MRIGVMLRVWGDRQGIGIYTEHLMRELIPLDRDNEYVLFYRDPAAAGEFADFDHVTERVLSAPNKAWWDQVVIPRHADRERVDLIFHPKFTVPLFTRCKTVMTVHGASWFVKPELYRKVDLAYINAVMPLYCRKATRILANSDLTRDDFIRLQGVDPNRIHTVRLGTSPDFRVIEDALELQRARERYRLPETFIFCVVRYDPRKNFGNLMAAFRLLRERMACKLVVAGPGCEAYIDDYGLDADGTSDDVRFLGWVENADLPVLYNLATCFFFPSVYEEFGIPTCEAMACGCPVVVSETGALPEVSGAAGLLVDPFDPAGMADALARVLEDSAMREEMSVRALARAREFTWRRCAEETLKVLNDA